MKVLFNCNLPFALAHGGHQIQIERTQAALQFIGLQVEPLRWWDDRQAGDIIHCFGRMPSGHIELAHQKGLKVMMAELLTGPGSRSVSQLRLQRTINRTLKVFAPGTFINAFSWKSYQLADACVALTTWEAHLMSYLFDAPPERIHVVPNGVEDVFLEPASNKRGPWLVCTATLTERKRVLELAEAAVHAQTPIWIIGKAYADTGAYAQRFFELVKKNPQMIRFEGAIEDRQQLARIYREARGFVLLSSMESLSLSALEAAACACPLLLSDLPWARSVFGENARYCPLAPLKRTAQQLREFYDQAPLLKAPPQPVTWIHVAHQLKTIYERILSTSR